MSETIKLQLHGTSVKEKQVYKLDVSKWRCGGDKGGDNKLGCGKTQMLNEEGFMCCLGQFAQQKGVFDDNLIGKDSPFIVNEMYDSNFVCYSNERHRIDNTTLARHLMGVNDYGETTPVKKIELIKNLLADEGLELEVIDTENILDKWKNLQ